MFKSAFLLTALLTSAASVAAQTPATPAEPAQPATPAQSLETAAPAEPVKPVPAPGEVARAQFTSGIENREPANELSSIASSIGTVYFFTDLRDFKGQTVTHRWSHNGDVVAEVPFNVGGPRWRVWSSKNLMPDWTGEWTVDVVAADGSVVESRTLTVTAPAADPMPVEGSAAPDNQGKK